MENQEKPTADVILASFEDRFIARSIDLIVLLCALGALAPSFSEFAPVPPRCIAPGLILIYLTILTASPFGATLAQIAQGLRVVNYAGNNLTLSQAALRSTIVLVLVTGALSIVSCATEPKLYIVALGSILIALAPAVMASRQGLQDILVGSAVIRRKALRRRDEAKRIRNVLGEGVDKPSALNILGSVLLVSVPTLSLLLMAVVHEGKSLRARVAYALQETSNLRSSIE